MSEPPGLQGPRRASGGQSTSDEGIRIAGVAVALAALTGLVLLLVHPAWNPARIRPLPLVGAAFIAFAFAAWLLRGISARWSVALILLGGIALQVAAISAPPRQSDDMYRYIWDGRVQAAGIDPYAHVPAAPQLTGLRNEFLWPTGGHCVTHRIPPESTVPVVAGCTMINRPTVPTIYPPVAEAYFFGVYKLSPAGSGTTPMQAAAGACAILITVLLLYALRSMGRDFRTAAYWAWCPTVALEVGNNAHVDVLAVGLAAAALVILAKAGRMRRSVFGGVLLGLAIATKITPVLVVPAVLRRRWAAVGAALAGAVAVVYLPHVLAVGTKVLGYMPGYLQENGYSNGARFAIIGLAVSGRVAILTAVVLLAVAGLAVLRFSDPDQPWRGALVMTGAALTITTPSMQWYPLLLVMLVALDGRAEWLAFSAGAYVAAESQMGQFSVPHPRAAGYALAAFFVAVVWVVRHVSSQPPYQVLTATPAPAARDAAMTVN
ncbi:MAG TPA: glycosyltransferase 87 family protein [Streptosporangiaceae bacterium]